LKICVFITSSTGNGEFPDNGEGLHKFLRRHTQALTDTEESGPASQLLSHVFYTILGLGDSNYSKYQGAPRYLDFALQKLGAHQFYKRGEADEATSLELVVEPWVEGVYPAVEKQFKVLKKMPKSEVQDLLKPVIVVAQSEEKEAPEDKKRVEQMTTQARVVGGQIIINKPDRQVIELEIKTDKEIAKELIEVGSSF